MQLFKTEEEIEILRLNAEIVSKTLAHVAKAIQPGVTTVSYTHLTLPTKRIV